MTAPLAAGTRVWNVGEGTASWHQARAHQRFAGVVTGFATREDAERWAHDATANRVTKGLPVVRYTVFRSQQAAS